MSMLTQYIGLNRKQSTNPTYPSEEIKFKYVLKSIENILVKNITQIMYLLK